jgi:hypothetical protein
MIAILYTQGKDGVERSQATDNDCNADLNVDQYKGVNGSIF